MGPNFAEPPYVLKYKYHAQPALRIGVGARYVISQPNFTGLDCAPPRRFVVIAFDSAEKALAWNDTASTREVTVARIKTTDSMSCGAN